MGQSQKQSVDHRAPFPKTTVLRDSICIGLKAGKSDLGCKLSSLAVTRRGGWGVDQKELWKGVEVAAEALSACCCRLRGCVQFVKTYQAVL